MARQLPPFNPRPPGPPARLTLRPPQARAAAAPPAAAATADDLSVVTNWLTSLQTLQGVAFNYLVPDIGMLPAESIRFFTVDPNWTAALIDGAFSVGNAAVTQAGGPALSLTPQPISGFLLRSAVVAGWPGMQITAFADIAGDNPLPAVRLETVAPSLLLALFAGSLMRVDFQEPSEALHFGVDTPCPAPTKTLRWATDNGDNLAGTKISGLPAQALPLRGTGQDNVLRIDAIATTVMAVQVGFASASDFTAAAFGVEMIEGVQKVTFELT